MKGINRSFLTGKAALQTILRRWREGEPGSLLGLQLKASVGTGVETDYTSAFQQPTPTRSCIPRSLLLNIAASSQADRRAPAGCARACAPGAGASLHTLLIW